MKRFAFAALSITLALISPPARADPLGTCGYHLVSFRAEKQKTLSHQLSRARFASADDQRRFVTEFWRVADKEWFELWCSKPQPSRK